MSTAQVLKEAERILRAASDERWSAGARRPWFTSYGAILDKQQHFVPLFPDHEIFVAPFCGHGEALYLDKDPAPAHLADVDERIVRLHRFAKNLKPEQLRALKQKNWTGSRETFNSMKKMEEQPRSDIDFVYREVYLRGFSVTGTNNPNFRPTDSGRVLDIFDRLEYAHELWKGNTLTKEDYKQTFKRLDAAGALFFADPPYPDSAGSEGSESLFDFGCPPVEEFAEVFSGAKGSTVIITTGKTESVKPFLKKMYHKRFRWPIRQRLQGFQRAHRVGWIFTNFKSQGVSKDLQVQVPVNLVDEAAAIVAGDPTAPVVKADISYEEETALIRENAKKPEAQQPHKFKAAEWTHKNGHPRCIICGGEERTDGMCEGVEKSIQEAELFFKGEDDLKTRGPYFVTYGILTKFKGLLLPMFPEHKTYVELFCGNGEMIWHKDPSEREIMNDLDPEIVRLHTTCQKLTDADLTKLEGMDWIGREKKFNELVAQKAGKGKVSDLEWFHRELYLSRFSKWGREAILQYAERNKRGFRELDEGRKYAQVIARLRRARERLKNVEITRLDFRAACKKFGGPDTFIFADPPYPSIEYNYYQLPCPEMEEIRDALQESGSPWLVITESQKDPSLLNPFRTKGIYERKFRWPRAWHGTGSKSSPKQRFVMGNVFTNYHPPKGSTKAVVKAIEQETYGSAVDRSQDHTLELIPGSVEKAEDEQFVLGIVLVPEEEDAQGDIYSHEEVRQAAHEYLARWRNRGYQHKVPVNDKVDLVESYIAPVDMTIDGKRIKRGTWMAGMHVKDAAMWREVKNGTITGFSIGGSAEREAA